MMNEKRRIQNIDNEKDDRKRKYNSAANNSHEVTKEDYEAHKLKRRHFEDPMNKFLDDDKLLWFIHEYF